MDQQIGSDGSSGHMTVVQAIPTTNNQVQVVQAGQVIQSANGQQIVVHAVPQNAGQSVHLGSPGNQQLQLLQLPVQVCLHCVLGPFLRVHSVNVCLFVVVLNLAAGASTVDSDS